MGGLPGNVHVLRPFPMLWRVLGHPRTTLGRHAASIMSTRRACSGPSGAGRRKPMFSEVGRGTGRPQISAGTRAMMLMMLTGRPQRWLPRACNDAGRGGGRETKRDGVRAHACTSCWPGREGQGGGGGPRARARGPPPPSARSSLPPVQ